MIDDPSDVRGEQPRLPFVIFVLATGTFLMGTTEFVIAGLLPRDRRGPRHLRRPRRAAHHDLRPRHDRRNAGHVIVALGSGFGVLLAARFLTALATGAFWAVAAVVAARVAGEGMSSRAIGVVLGGGLLSTVVGVPLAAFAGQLIGWRGPFWALTGLGAVAALFILPTSRTTTPPARHRRSRPS